MKHPVRDGFRHARSHFKAVAKNRSKGTIWVASRSGHSGEWSNELEVPHGFAAQSQSLPLEMGNQPLEVRMRSAQEWCLLTFIPSPNASHADVEVAWATGSMIVQLEEVGTSFSIQSIHGQELTVTRTEDTQTGCTFAAAVTS